MASKEFLLSIIFISAILNYFNVCESKYPLDNNTQYIFDQTKSCKGILTPEITRKLKTYIPTVNKIVTKLSTDPNWIKKTWNELADLSDTIGPRIAGSNGERQAIEYFYKELRKLDTLEVRKEKITIQKQIWGKQTLKMLKPRTQEMAVIPAKGSGHTPGFGIFAEAVVVSSLAELQTKKPDELLNKIVVYNHDFESAGGFYSGGGATKNIFNYVQDKTGAIAVIATSLTSFSMYTLHVLNYGLGPTKIPLATITIEDAQMLYRIYRRGKSPIVLYLNLDIQTIPGIESWNIVANLKGSTKSKELVGITGHLDNVALGFGIQDDAIGPMFVKNSFELFKALNLNPARTIRGILFTSEEYDLQGARCYVKEHESEITKFKALFEADAGCLATDGWKVLANPIGFSCFLSELMNVLFPDKNYDLIVSKGLATDVELFNHNGLVGTADLNGDRIGRYRWYYHTSSDTMATVEPEKLNGCLALYAVSSYVLADFDELPF